MKSDGFTLVELSISIVIIGLLVGGIMAGRNLIHAAELRGAIAEYQQYVTAINNFTLRYDAFPGDFTKAGKIWGYADTDAADGTCNTPLTSVGSGTETCDGNGDGIIGNDNQHEMHRSWQHMANAGLIEGQYTGAQGSWGNRHTVIGENGPESKYSGAGWGLEYRGEDGDNWFFQKYYENAFFFGGQHFANAPIEKILPPADAWHIDSKIDDGMPNQGHTIAHWWNDCTTAVDKDDVTAEYLLTEDAVECSLIFNELVR